ncbi:MAG: NAD(P)-dependent oxidoreductase [Pseudoflavonifractor sp.]
MKIGFIGLGAMGKPMASNLLAAGYQVYAFDLVAAAVKEVEAKGAIACPDAGALAAQADVIISSLPNAKIVEAVMNGKGGVFECCKPGTIVVDMSSVAPNTSKSMAKLAAGHGVGYVDAPVSGGVTGATAGTLTIMIGSDEATFEKLKPIFDVLGKNIYHVGEVGGGDAIKMVNNLLLGCNMAALSEALTLGVKCGLSTETMREIISKSSGGSYALTAKLEKFIMADSFAGGFAVDLQYKDLGLALEAARDNAVPLPMTAAATALYEAARAKGQGREDMSSVVKVWQDLTGAQICGTDK